MIINIPRPFRNTLTVNTSGLAPSDNPPDMDPPIFRHNATAAYYRAIRNSLASFRTDLALFSVDSGNHGRSSLSTLQRYPFDEWVEQIRSDFPHVTSRKFGLKLYSELRNGVNIWLTKYIYGLYLCLRTFNMPMHHMLNARVVHYQFRTLLTPTRLLITRPLPYAPQLH